MHVLVTRSPADAAELVGELKARGHDGLVEPMFEIVSLRQHPAALSLALDGTQALLFTSANGVRAFAEQAASRSLPAFAVGDATAEAARAAGFGEVESAGGNVENLADLVIDRLDPAQGALFHAAGSQLAGDLKGALSDAGFEVRRLMLYEARPSTQLSDATTATLRAGAFDAVLFFSPRSASTFVRLLTEAGMQGACRRSHAVCLSPAVATEVESLAWRGIHVAERPNTAALLVAFDRVGAILDRPAKADADGAPIVASPSAAGGPEETNTTKSAMEQDKDKTQDGQQGESSGGRVDARTDARTDAPADTQAGAQVDAPALQVIAAFGGIRPMAAKLGIAVSTVQGWRERAVIPTGRHEQIAAAAKSQGVALSEALLAASDKAPTAPGETQGGSPAMSAGSAGDKKQPVSSVIGSSAGVSAVPSSAATAAAAAAKADAKGSPASAASNAKAVSSSEKDVASSSQAKPSEAKPADSKAAAATTTSAKTPSSTPTGTPSAAVAAPQQATPRRSGGLAFFLLGALVLAAGAAGAVVTRDSWGPLLDSSASADADAAALEAVEQRLAALESDLADLDGRLGMLDVAPDAGEAVSGLTSDLDDLAKRVGALESNGQSGAGTDTIAPLQQSIEDVSARLASLEDAAASGGGEDAAAALAKLSENADLLAGRLAETESRLGSLEDADSALRSEVEALDAADRADVEAATGGTALALAIGQLRVALRLSSPYATELAQVRSLVQDDVEATALLMPLDANAGQGVPTLEGLRRRFPEAARLAAAAGQGDDSEGFMGGVLRRISKVVTVRPVGMVEGEDAGSVVARAEARLEDGDLAGAVRELDGLTGLAAEAIASWRGQAEARLAADQAVSALAALAIGKLTAAGG